MEVFENNFKNYNKTIRRSCWLKEHYYRLRSDLGVFFREQKAEIGTCVIDCFPDFWLYFQKNFNGEVSLSTPEGEKRIYGNMSIYVPTFSILKWNFYVDEFEWFSYQGISNMGCIKTDVPIMFPCERKLHLNEETIIDEITQNQKNWCNIGFEKERLGSAIRIKHYIDSHFSKDLSISEIALALNYSPDVMTRVFKRMYEVTPLIYLKNLKYFQAALMITHSDEKINKVSKDLGMNNYENFSKSFRVLFKTSPKGYREKEDSIKN
ncbi:MAG: helix-turn-helix transcriptional regulator [Halobacteriovoraceae bacterium]|nr:helix-turn-helix transcriptional regulator [Halobacteriovoraceae bacterium]